jgi:hypothetical protein
MNAPDVEPPLAMPNVETPPLFVPFDFTVPLPPRPPEGGAFRLTPLRIEHNQSDLEAWSSSVEHIHATPGFAGSAWPNEPMTLARNADDIREHEADFKRRRGFTYAVVAEPGGQVVGCVYIYPSRRQGLQARVRSWVRASHAELDPLVYRTVFDWLIAAWPFTSFDYTPRPVAGSPAGSPPLAEPPATS